MKTYLPLDPKTRKTTVLSVKNYVYETINGKRKRVSPLVFNEKGEISEIRQRAITGKFEV